ncbi:alpha/beta hydrolase [Curvibacter sp. HBC61]|uniref:Alpha/beta hydrolase n=1 Tax=Curvibacter cyanobacteriorum TaxID=3026422 RepID=A0ABT5N1W7_9BURK|nr:alpha/beta hydrolase [Curvibacter sp. HBC61]MDD0840058.1 alpha/beta hydrolase [Curvibacter sp. HBC61]
MSPSAPPHAATAGASARPERVRLRWRERTVEIELQWLHTEATQAPLLVFLHEGLGSVAMWKDFPQRLCQALGWRGLVYSRPGYGQSTPRPADEHWAPDFLHQQAHEVLPALLQALDVAPTEGRPPVWLLGHSDGGSIALLHASRADAALGGVIVLAPHILVEPLSLASIEEARQAYLAPNSPLRAGLARYHADVDSAFWGWNRIWLAPEFESWNIEHELATLTCPVLAIQGLDDPYGTLAQIRGIAQRAPQTRLLELPHCGHSPHRDQPQALIDAIQAFVNNPPRA